MSLTKRAGIWYLRLRWRDAAPMSLSTGTGNKAQAEAMHRTLAQLHTQGRLDLLGLLKARRLTIRQVHNAATAGSRALEALHLRANSPATGPLYDEWISWCASPAGVSPRTKRHYAPKTIQRYAVSWAGFFEVLPAGRDARLSDLTAGFIADYKGHRVRAIGGKARAARPAKPLAVGTVNRDLAALGAFLTWCADVKGLAVARPKLQREREPQGRERWLSPEELRDLEATCLERWPEWWPLFATLVYTGMRYGEAAGLCAADVRLAQRRISIHEGARRVKTASSVRDVPVPEPLAQLLAAHLARIRPAPTSLVFPAPFSVYARARATFGRLCIAAGIHDGAEKQPQPTATVHDLRHTFGVHAALSGVPIVRLQKLLGHATPLMTMRYMAHAPEAYFSEDAGRIAASMAAPVDAEGQARADLARQGMRTA